MKNSNRISPKKKRIGDDLIRGAAAIAQELGEPLRRVYHLLETGQIPAFRLGGRWYVRRSSLRDHFDQLEQEAHHG